jgi:hypothetical protein
MLKRCKIMTAYIDDIRAVALDLKELASPAYTELDFALLEISKNIYDLVKDEEVSCDICGDYHDADSIPLSCKTGDGE